LTTTTRKGGRRSSRYKHSEADLKNFKEGGDSLVPNWLVLLTWENGKKLSRRGWWGNTSKGLRKKDTFGV